MLFFRLIYALFFWLYNTIEKIWDNDKAIQLKEDFDARCINYFRSIQHLNNNDLIKATYSIVIGLTAFGFFEVWLASKFVGSQHLLVQQMILVMMFIAYIVRMGYLTDEQIEVLKADCQKNLDKWIDLCFKWIPRIAAFLIMISFIPNLVVGREPDPQQIAAFINANLDPPVIIAFILILLIPVILYGLLFAFPILIVRAGILNAIRWNVNKTLARGNTKPFVIISWLVSTAALIEALYALRALM
jgi:hypothetical protein